jgi:DNA-binding NarL/FixJ family response regulator
MSGAASSTGIYLLHDCTIVRAGLRAILSGQPGLHVSASAQWPAADEDCVVIADYASVMQAARLPERRTRLMVFTSLRKECQVLRAMEAGVLGYLVQECAADDVLAGVRAAAQGNRYLCAAAKQGVLNSLGRQQLTPREEEVLHVLARGCPDKTIARELGIGLGTVKTHMKQLMHKLDAACRTQVVLAAFERGLLAA